MIFFDALRLCLALVALPDVRPATACTAAVAITIAADASFDAATIAAIAWSESRFEPTAHNACCAGPMAVKGFRGGELAGYRAGVAMLHDARRWCLRRRTPGSLCELAVYASGPRGAREQLYRGPRSVLRRAAIIRSAVGRHGAARDARSGRGPHETAPGGTFLDDKEAT